MNIFRIRILKDGQNDFLREIEIRSDQTFRVLHDFIVRSLNLSTRELASFHITDTNWNKLQEITLIDMWGDFGKKGKNDTPSGFLMSKTPLNTFLAEIDQRFIYEYDFLQMHTFLLEIVDVSGSDGKKSYPKMCFSSGQLSLKDVVEIQRDSDALAQELLNDFNSMMVDDFDDDNDYDAGNDNYDIGDDDY